MFFLQKSILFIAFQVKKSLFKCQEMAILKKATRTEILVAKVKYKLTN
jgi:hypothetical protein